jgi:hypothetical protein
MGSVQRMTRGEANVIRAFVLWTLFVWLVRVRNIVGDPEHSFGFKAVHVALAVVSVAFAVAAWIVVMRNRRKGRPVDRSESSATASRVA